MELDNRRKIYEKIVRSLDYSPDSADAAGLTVMGMALLLSGQSDISVFSDVRMFHEKMGIKPELPLAKGAMAFRLTLINEEHKELIKAIAEGDLAGELDACIDLIYVLAGTIAVRGWDGEEAWRRVHAANMTKMPAPEPTIRAAKTGQIDVIKPTNWIAPDLTDLVK